MRDRERGECSKQKLAHKIKWKLHRKTARQGGQGFRKRGIGGQAESAGNARAGHVVG